jgi:hypothetical protein
MISPLLDIINNYDLSVDTPNDLSDDLPEEVPRLIRYSRVICRSCNNMIASIPTYSVYRECPIMCKFCSFDIMDSSRKIQSSLRSRKITIERRKNLLDDIIKFGLNPDRIHQTLLFDNDVFDDKIFNEYNKIIKNLK